MRCSESGHELFALTLTNPSHDVHSSNTEKKPTDGSDSEDEGDGTTSLLSVSACNNTLNLVMRDEGVMRFVKYVSASAPGSRWDIAVEYEIAQKEGEEEGSSASGSDSEGEDGSEGESEGDDA